MPHIEFAKTPIGAEKLVEAAEGGDLVDVCDEHLAPVPFSCRSATCGTCQVEVLAGSELLEPPSPEEQELLDILRAPKTTRLACQAVIKSGDGIIRLRALEV